MHIFDAVCALGAGHCKCDTDVLECILTVEKSFRSVLSKSSTWRVVDPVSRDLCVLEIVDTHYDVRMLFNVTPRYVRPRSTSKASTAGMRGHYYMTGFLSDDCCGLRTYSIDSHA